MSRQKSPELASHIAVSSARTVNTARQLVCHHPATDRSATNEPCPVPPHIYRASTKLASVATGLPNATVTDPWSVFLLLVWKEQIDACLFGSEDEEEVFFFFFGLKKEKGNERFEEKMKLDQWQQ